MLPFFLQLTSIWFGAGEFGRNHARVYRELENVELAGVFDVDSARATAARLTEGPLPSFTTTSPSRTSSRSTGCCSI